MKKQQLSHTRYGFQLTVQQQTQGKKSNISQTYILFPKTQTMAKVFYLLLYSIALRSLSLSLIYSIVHELSFK